ncbi:receptor-type tyrosine-protein phosphatase epsilon-like [Asterias rubens]|uniref:receptor-type tyrosine-protein phosphatase epsilon-like n=1 Tax=Asterias rubens TaxID=7604 RepID=UPI001455B61C|nr:receptor-type tyrosine-protein phosphatase epsilon-like [Asterias rubens]
MHVFTSVETDLDAPAKPTSASSSTITSSSVAIALHLPISSPYITGIQIGVRRVQPIVTAETTNSRHLRSSNATMTNEYIAAELRKNSLPETFTVGDGKYYGGYHNTALKSNTTYAIYLGSVSRTSDKEFSVVWGEPLRIKVPGGMWVQGYSTQKPIAVPEGSFPLVPVVIPTSVLFLIGCVVTAITYRRKKDAGTHHSKPDESSHTSRDIDEEVETSFSVVEHSPERRPTETKPQPAIQQEQLQPRGIALTEFEDYVSGKKSESHKDGNGFLRDFESLPVGPLHLITVAKHEQNKEKNRYVNVLPYDYSRVVLEQLPDEPFSDYINASYMDGFNEPNAYIACQGPTNASIDDMWRMVWQQNSATMVMLTNLEEGNKIKCEKYWPDQTAVYGNIIVNGNMEEKHDHYVIRDFLVACKSQERCSRNVRQYHFCTWPDMGLPDDPSVVVNFIQLIKEYNPKKAGPMIVHCSAGIGRTGVFIVLHSMFEKAKIEGRVDIWNFVCAMRDQRLHMIQTAVQYEFLFDVLHETILSGDTAIRQDSFLAELAFLKKVTTSTGKSGLQQQLEKLNSVTKPVNRDDCQAGQMPENAHKNRYPDKIPVDRFRPHLMSGGSESSTDYINASFLNSPSCKGVYIVTQMPWPHNVNDMWRMVNDYNVTCIVMLNPKHDMNQSCGQYWPEEQSPIKSGSYTITLQHTERIDDNIIVRYMTLVTCGKQRARLICHLQFLDWPNEGLPSSCKSVLKLVKAVKKWKQEHGKHRVAVHCIDGEGASGTFCALSNIMEKLEDEKVVDIFQSVKKIRATCPRLVWSLAHYTFLYEAVKTYLNQDVVYENLL